ncbi:hypothetical protein CRUP_032084, partial [Coryphaenoides rupestris]
ISLDGFFPKPGVDYFSSSSSSHDKTFIFVNNRPVQQKDITKLLRQHYTAQYPSESNRNRYPVLILRITLPPSSIDVNLTPDKTQVLFHNKEALLTALEALLVSLYGYRSPSGSAPSELDTPTPAGPPRSPHGARDTSPTERSARTSEHAGHHPGLSHKRHEEDEELKTTPEGGAADRPTGTSRSNTNHPTSNSNSSSSSVAEDWIVNQMGCFGGNLLDDDNTALSSPGKLFAPLDGESQPGGGGGGDDDGDGDAGGRRPMPSAESWSKGVALTDPVSGAPLQPVRIHQVPVGSPDKKPLLNAVTEKRASLTAYDLISSRTARAPLSAIAMFEREARAGVLRERPAASLQEISDVVRERWKNLGEEERKK